MCDLFLFLTGIAHLIGGDDSDNFDGRKYFELCRKTADIIEIFLKQKVDHLPIPKKQNISESDTATHGAISNERKRTSKNNKSC